MTRRSAAQRWAKRATKASRASSGSGIVDTGAGGDTWPASARSSQRASSRPSWSRTGNRPSPWPRRPRGDGVDREGAVTGALGQQGAGGIDHPPAAVVDLRLALSELVRAGAHRCSTFRQPSFTQTGRLADCTPRRRSTPAVAFALVTAPREGNAERSEEPNHDRPPSGASPALGPAARIARPSRRPRPTDSGSRRSIVLCVGDGCHRGLWGIHVALVVSVPLCLAAGWWQVHRAESGNILSYGYAVEWPLFAVAAVYLWWHLIHMEPDGDRRDGTATGGEPGGATTTETWAGQRDQESPALAPTTTTSRSWPRRGRRKTWRNPKGLP